MTPTDPTEEIDNPSETHDTSDNNARLPRWNISYDSESQPEPEEVLTEETFNKTDETDCNAQPRPKPATKIKPIQNPYNKKFNKLSKKQQKKRKRRFD